MMATSSRHGGGLKFSEEKCKVFALCLKAQLAEDRPGRDVLSSSTYVEDLRFSWTITLVWVTGKQLPKILIWLWAGLGLWKPSAWKIFLTIRAVLKGQAGSLGKSWSSWRCLRLDDMFLERLSEWGFRYQRAICFSWHTRSLPTLRFCFLKPSERRWFSEQK